MPGDRRERTTPLMMGQVLGQEDSLGRTTDRFFAEGEEHERRGWDDVLLDDDLEPKRRRGSIDKVPRRLSAVVALAIFCIFVVAGAAIASYALVGKGDRADHVRSIIASIRSWFTVSQHEPTAVSPSNRTPAGTQPRKAPQVLAQPPVQQPPAPALPQPRAQAPSLPQPRAQAPAPMQTPAKAPAAAPAAPSLPQPRAQAPAPTQTPAPAKPPAAAPPASKAVALPAAIPEAQKKLEKAAIPPDPEGAERLRQNAIAVRKRRQQRRAEEDYVWSQELKALVPASSMEQAPPPPQPNAAPRR